jgi:hypothetical protein
MVVLRPHIDGIEILRQRVGIENGIVEAFFQVPELP